MQHLDPDRLIELARGRGTAVEQEHLASCRVCREAAGRWRRWLGGLDELGEAALSEGERHQLRTLFTQLGPGRRQSWVARLVERRPASALAFRGASAARLDDLEAGPYRGLLQVRPAGDGTFDLHFMVRGRAAESLADSRLVLRGPSGHAHVTRFDEHGEAHVRGVEAGRYAAVCWLPSGRIELPEVDVGGHDGG